MNLLSKCFLFILNNIASQGSILRINHFTKKNKKKCVNGTWTETDELENILDDYEVIKK